MGATFHSLVVYGKVIKHDPYGSAKKCCREERATSKFCCVCGVDLLTLDIKEAEELYPGLDCYCLNDKKNDYLIGYNMLDLDYESPPIEFTCLEVSTENIVKEQLGDDCKYLVYQYVSY